MIRRLATPALFLSAACGGAVAFSPSRPMASGAHVGMAALFATRDEAETPGAERRRDARRITSLDVSRRRWVSSIASSSTAACAALLSRPPIAEAAAPPLTAEAANDFAARAERALRPKPAKVLRPRMSLDFAVLLMRSSYNAVDEIDVVAMDQFQRDFFLIRQAEYKPYADSLGAGAMVQGDLADPNYFDFISFAQYATVSREVANPASVFEEQQGVEVGEDEPQRFDTVVVRRDPSLTNADLPRRHTELVGNAILDKLDETFGGTASAIPKIEPRGGPGETNSLLAAIKQLVNLFLVKGFAWAGSASMVPNKDGTMQFSITFTSPATLWSGQSLKAKNALLTNDFALKTVKAMVSRAGYGVANASVKYANNQEITTFTVV